MGAVLEFMQQNALATYGAIVGTIALVLNFMRYRHIISGSKIKLKLEVVAVMDRKQFAEAVNRSDEEKPFGASDSHITHKIQVRNVGSVSAYIQDAWAETSSGRKNGTIRGTGGTAFIYHSVPEAGSVEVLPRSAQSFSLFSKGAQGYLNITRAHVIDATGKKWRSQRL